MLPSSINCMVAFRSQTTSKVSSPTDKTNELHTPAINRIYVCQHWWWVYRL